MQILESLLLCLTVLLYPAASPAMPDAPTQPVQDEAPAAPAPVEPQPAPDTPVPAEPQPEAPAPVAPVPAPEAPDEPVEEDMTNTPARPVELQDVMEEVAELRAQVLKLQQTLDTWMETSLADLKAENETLRRELRDLHKIGAVDVPPVPAPVADLLRDALADPGAEIAEPAPPPDPEIVSAVAAGGYLTVAEWGASPEDAAKSTPPRASLKGLIAVVLPGTSDEDLRALGKRLRNECKDYDNINIEVFDERAAAEAFKSGQPVEGIHRVLSVSRHKASGRDVILLLKGASAITVPLED
jgi:hypothetical protein